MTTDSLIQIGEPVEHRGIVLAPLFPRRQPRAQYVTLDEALGLGFRVTEVRAAGSVPELLATNPTGAAVIVCNDEELLGAKQNRILNVTVLVGARSKARIPVSCVEQGRWSARSVAFSSAAHTAYPELRRRKAERLAAAPLRPGVAQDEVWSAVAEKSIRLDAYSRTGAQSDIFASRERDLGGLRDAFPLEPGQAGALVALGPDLLCLDYLSRPEAFARLYPKLLDGYLLDAIEHLDVAPVDRARLEGFVGAVTAAPRRREPSPGLGEDVRLCAKGLVGSGLELDGELLQLSGFSTAQAASAILRNDRADATIEACGGGELNPSPSPRLPTTRSSTSSWPSRTSSGTLSTSWLSSETGRTTMSHKSAKPHWMPQEEWDEWVAGQDERDRRLWERIKTYEAERKAREQAEADAAARPRRRRLFGFL